MFLLNQAQLLKHLNVKLQYDIVIIITTTYRNMTAIYCDTTILYNYNSPASKLLYIYSNYFYSNVLTSISL